MRVFCTRCGVRMEVADVPASATVECTGCGARIGLHSMMTQAPAAASPWAELDAGRMVGGYRVESEIGRGGMGIVYRATQLALNRAVAMKVLPREMTTSRELLARFEREAQALATLKHPRIVAIYDKGWLDGRPYFVMELVEGQPLRRKMAAGRLPAEDALRIVDQVLEALEVAHANGIVHRDLKPENVVLDVAGDAKVMDFGIARLEQDTRLTATRAAMGTLHYMAPEQAASSGRVDGRADLYSVGVVLYELLTGALPLGAFRPPSEVARGVDPGLDAVVLRALQPDPNDRFVDAKAMRAALSLASRTRSQKSSRAGVVAAAAAFVVVAVVATALVTSRGGSTVEAPRSTPTTARIDSTPSSPPASPTAVAPPTLTDEGTPLAAPGGGAASPDLSSSPSEVAVAMPSRAVAVAPSRAPSRTPEPARTEERKTRRGEAGLEPAATPAPTPTEESVSSGVEPALAEGDPEEGALQRKRKEFRVWLTEAQASPPTATSLPPTQLLTKAYSYLDAEGFTAQVNEPQIGLLVATKADMPISRRIDGFVQADPKSSFRGMKEVDKGWKLKVIVWIDGPDSDANLYVRALFLADTGESKVDEDTRKEVLEAMGYR